MTGGTHAVVVNWNGGEDNLLCLRSLVAQGLEPGCIVVVDNGSSDGSPEAIEREFPGVCLLRNVSNLGFAAGCNRGIQRALDEGAETLFLVNNDLTLPEPDTLSTLERALEEEPGVGIVGPRVLYTKDPTRVWCAGGRLTFRQNLSRMIGHREPDGPGFQVSRDVDYVPGCAMLVRRAVFERVGLFHGEYFAYHEDLELCVRAAESGFRVRIVGGVAVHHDAHASTGGGYNARRKYMMGVNTVWFLRRHGTPLRWVSFWIFDVATLPLVWVLRSLRGEGAAVLAKARGTLDGLRGKRVTAELLESWRGSSS